MAIPIRNIDHVVIMASDIERSIVFYRDVLGGALPFESAYREGKVKVMQVVLGGAVVNLQKLDDPAYIVADRLESGSVDLCFRWDADIEAAVDYLTDRGVEIIEGPVPRPAADGVWGQSVYFRDPDGNLLEFLTTATRSDPIF
ncbi:MAG: VOC family protein [Alphaproteobacteria bacterium]|nr:VOC family protein [Alphaproteobacteria bacterium]MDP6516665.1 VOC family protein [Alphaproteobacteria bacterium]